MSIYYYELKTCWVELSLAKKLNVFVKLSAPEHIIFLAEMSGYQLVNEFIFLSLQLLEDCVKNVSTCMYMYYLILTYRSM